MDFSPPPGTIKGRRKRSAAGKEREHMSCHNEGCGCGKFFVGMGLGLMVGAGLGMTMSPSRRQVRRVAHKAAQRVNEVGGGKHMGSEGRGNAKYNWEINKNEQEDLL